MLSTDRLLLVAGPSCSGKSTLIQQLCAGELPRVVAQLRLGDPAAWRCVLPQDVAALDGEQMERMILHYDFLRPWTGNGTPAYQEDDVLRLAGTAAEVTLVTLWVPPDELRRRIVERRSAFAGSLLRGRPWDSETLRTSRRNVGPPPDNRRSLGKTLAIVQELRRLHAKVRSYRRPGELESLYEGWIAFWQPPRQAEHWILDSAADPAALVPLAEWRQRR
jgi:hypothetical protein